MRPLLILALVALGVVGCASTTVTVPATVKAPPQTASLEWRERYPGTRPALVLGVSRFTVTREGWTAEISVENTSTVAWTVGDPRAAADRQFGVLLFPTDDLNELERRSRGGDIPAIRAATSYAPALPQTLRPGQTWKGTIAAPGALGGGLWVRLSFGPFASVGDPPEGAQTPVVWVTDHAYHLDAVIAAIRVLADPAGGGLAAARIAVSTAGRTAGIRRLAAVASETGFHKLRLAVSVNAPTDALRSQLMPINRVEPLAALRDAIASWPATRTRPVMIEYVLIAGINDAPEHATALAEWLRGLHAAVNVIPLNPRSGSPLAAPADATIDVFLGALHTAGQTARRRVTTGRDVMAACGQLGNAGARRA